MPVPTVLFKHAYYGAGRALSWDLWGVCAKQVLAVHGFTCTIVFVGVSWWLKKTRGRLLSGRC